LPGLPSTDGETTNVSSSLLSRSISPSNNAALRGGVVVWRPGCAKLGYQLPLLYLHPHQGKSVMQRVAIIGLGVMGSGMAANWLAKGFAVTVYNRTRAKRNRWRPRAR
jgi:phosphoglycerate dehydrogenase-like enzyme